MGGQRRSHPVLEEIGVQVLVEPVLELGLAGTPHHLVGKCDLSAIGQQLLLLVGQVHLYNALAVVADLEPLVRVDVVVVAVPLAHLESELW